MKKYKIIFANGNIKILVGKDLSLEDAAEIIGKQLEPACYEMIPQELEAG